MILSDDDRPIRIRPRKPPTERRENAKWAGAYKLLMHYARSGRKRGRSAVTASGAASTRRHMQRCAVRVTYLGNRTRGQWGAHGRYLVRESATESKAGGVGFNHQCDGIDMVRELEKWQSSGDQRLWKLILSPEFGDRIDLRRLTRDVIRQVEQDVGTNLEWAAVTHHNTEHPHVHMVIRGIGIGEESLHFKREYLKHGIRNIAEDLCTRQIGYRTSRDAAEAERREIGERRFTSLDRTILRRRDQSAPEPEHSDFIVVKGPVPTELADSAKPQASHIVARLGVLERMGLAARDGPNAWRVRRDLEQVLRAMQRTADRQRTLASHGVPLSDPRLPIEVLDIRNLRAVEGRVLVHGQDEQSGRGYLMLEGTDAKIHFVEYTSEMEMLRADGGLRPNSYLRIRKLIANGKTVVSVQDLGDSEKVLNNRALLRENMRALLKRGITPNEDGWGGWLGRYQAALSSVAREIHDEAQHARLSERRRALSRGR